MKTALLTLSIGLLQCIGMLAMSLEQQEYIVSSNDSEVIITFGGQTISGYFNQKIFHGLVSDSVSFVFPGNDSELNEFIASRIHLPGTLEIAVTKTNDSVYSIRLYSHENFHMVLFECNLNE